MKAIGNYLWLTFGGFYSGMRWILAGIICCITIIGIPLGIQCFKFSRICFSPFDCEVEYKGGAFSFIVNVIWFLFVGMEMALMNALIGCLWCVTIVGIPFGKQFFKIAKLSLAPMGAVVAEKKK